MEILQVTSVIVGIKNAIDIAKVIKDSGASLEKAEINLKIAELISALADAKIGMANIQDIVSEKDTEIKRLKSELDTRRKMIWESPYYYLETENEKDGPFCQKCYDSSHKLIRLQMPRAPGYWLCKECNCDYTDSSYEQPNYSSNIRRSHMTW